jgi:uncharacterized protein (DUF1330 family)
MRASYKLALTLLAGGVLGAAAIQGLHAQAKAPVYVIVDIADVTNPESFKTLLPKAGPAVDAFGGKFIARTEKITEIDGTPPKRFVVISFDSLDKAKAWSASAAQKEVDAIRVKSTKSRSFIVEGM